MMLSLSGLFGPKQPSPKTLSSLSDVKWLSVLKRSVNSRKVDGFLLPGFPDDSIQSGTVGSSGKATIDEAFAFYRFIRDLAKSKGRPLSPESTVLDFGVSWGRIIRCFLRDVNAKGLFGVDVNRRYLDEAVATEVPGTFAQISPLGKLPYPDNAFDVVYAYSVFTHLPEHVQTNWLAEIERTLKPGGLFVATVEPKRFLDFVRDMDEQTKARHKWFSELSKTLAKQPDAERCFAEKGFVFLPTNNSDTYGDAVISPEYVERYWGQYFEVLEYLDDSHRFWQAVVSATKRLVV